MKELKEGQDRQKEMNQRENESIDKISNSMLFGLGFQTLYTISHIFETLVNGFAIIRKEKDMLLFWTL